MKVDEIILITPNINYKEQAQEYMNEFKNETNNISGGGGIDRFNNYEEWLKTIRIRLSKL